MQNLLEYKDVGRLCHKIPLWHCCKGNLFCFGKKHGS